MHQGKSTRARLVHPRGSEKTLSGHLDHQIVEGTDQIAESTKENNCLETPRVLIDNREQENRGDRHSDQPQPPEHHLSDGPQQISL